MHALQRRLSAGLAACALATLGGAVPATAAPAARDHPAASTRMAGQDGFSLIVFLKSLGLGVEIGNGVVAGVGPALAVNIACRVAGTGLGLGAIAFYTGQNQTGTGVVSFVGNNDAASFSVQFKGATALNFQDCTTGSWQVTNSADTALDATETAGGDENIPPTDQFACPRHRFFAPLRGQAQPALPPQPCDPHSVTTDIW